MTFPAGAASRATSHDDWAMIRWVRHPRRVHRALGCLVGAMLLLGTSGCDELTGDPPEAEATPDFANAADRHPTAHPGLSKAEAFKACSDWLNREAVRWTLDPASTVVSRVAKRWYITGVGLDHGTGEIGGTPVQVSCNVHPDGTVEGEN